MNEQREKIDGGAVFWARQTIESEIFQNKPDKWFKIWFYLVSQAAWKDNGRLKRGELFTKYEYIRDATGANRNEIDHCIRWLKSATQIATRKATRGFIVTICNFDKYQNTANYKSDTKSDMKSDSKATQKRHYIKEGKEREEYNNKKDLPPYQEIVSLYHEILSELPTVKILTDTRKGKINGRWFSKITNSKGESINTLTYWEGFFKYVKTLRFLCGENDRGWKADLEWLVTESHFIDIIEGGKYKNGRVQ